MSLRNVALLTLATSTAALLLALIAVGLVVAVMRQSAAALRAVRDLERRTPERRTRNIGPPADTPERRRPDHLATTDEVLTAERAAHLRAHPEEIDDHATRHTPAHYQRPAVPPTDRERTTP